MAILGKRLEFTSEQGVGMIVFLVLLASIHLVRDRSRKVIGTIATILLLLFSLLRHFLPEGDLQMTALVASYVAAISVFCWSGWVSRRDFVRNAKANRT